MRPRVVIAVPARNEARRLPSLLSALAAQRDAPAFSLALLLDHCDDDSATVVGRLLPDLPYPVAVASRADNLRPNAGLARQRAAAFAIDGLDGGVLLTTDADSAPAPDWIAANLAALAEADLVAGRIVRRAGSAPLQDRVEDYYDRLHRLRRTIDPVPWDDVHTHHWTSGTSLAMTIATYRALGGFPAIPHGEDAALADRASRRGLRVRRDARVVVQTSSRRDGRAHQGFAAALSALDQPGAMPSLTHPEDEAWRYRHHASARAQFRSGALSSLAVALGLPEAELDQVAGEVPNGEAFAARIVGAPPAGLRLVPLPFAEVALAAIEAPHLQGAA